MECVAEWYSRNLAAEVAKGKVEMWHQGLHNNLPPFRYLRDPKDPKKLIHDPDTIAGVKLAFEQYATGKHSYSDLAQLLNQHGYTAKSGHAFSREAVRGTIRNQLYIGKVKYQESRRNADGTRNFSALIQWLDGQHEPLISEELFNRCQNVRATRNNIRVPEKKYNHYLLRGLVFCHNCCSHATQETSFRSWGKMYCQKQQGTDKSFYRCSGKQAGFTCSQGGVRVHTIDEQVIAILSALKPPVEWRNNILSTIGDLIGEQQLETRLLEIKRTIERMDFRWDQGFITDKNEYLEKRIQLQQELEQLTPVQDDLEAASDILEHFQERYLACNGNVEKQHELVCLIVERVYVDGNKVVAVTLKSDYHVILGHKTNEPTYSTVDPYLSEWTQADTRVAPSLFKVNHFLRLRLMKPSYSLN